VSDVTVKRIDEMERTFGGAFVLARASLGVTSFGFQVLDLPPGWEGPEHTHEGMTGELAAVANDGQEEVYFALQGSAVLRLDDGEVALEPGVMVRCGPAQMRQLLTRESAAQVLAIGGIPGGAYKAPGFTELPDQTGS
jgi:mannose-6-phosphate isomerase-like protein (cupin superfamily)